MGSMLNFTMVYHAIPVEKIGTAPVESPANASGKWGGLFGRVFSGEYQMSTALWNNRKGVTWCSDAFQWLDSAPLI